MKLSIDELAQRVAAELRAAGANPAMADSTARALVLAESQGLASHGLSRVAQYTTHLRNGRVVGAAQARVAQRKGGGAADRCRRGPGLPGLRTGGGRGRGRGARARAWRWPA